MPPAFAPPLHVASFAAGSSSAVKVAPVQARPRRKQQLALAVDGEGLWRYDVESLHPTWSFTVPPSTSFSTPPLTLAPAASDDYYTLASTSAPSPELWAFRTEAAGKEAVPLPAGREVAHLFGFTSDEGALALAVTVPASPSAKGKAREYAVVSLSTPALALSSLSLPKAYTPPPRSTVVHTSLHPSSAFPSLAQRSGSVLLEVYDHGEVRVWSIVAPEGSGMTARKGALELVLEGAKRAEWEEGEKAVEVALVNSPSSAGALHILTDRSHMHTLSLSLSPLGASSALLSPPPHSLTALSPYALLLTPSQLHVLSPLFGAVVGSFPLPTALSSALALGRGRVAFVGKKAEKWGVWVGEVGVSAAGAGGVGEVMFTKEQTAKVLGPIHPTPAAAVAAPEVKPSSSAANASSAARLRNFDALLAANDWDALLALVSSASAAAALPAANVTLLLSTLFALDQPPALAKTKGETELSKARFLAAVCKFGVRDDGEWKTAFAGVGVEHAVQVLEIVQGWVNELVDVGKEAEWTEVGKGLPSLAEIVPLVTLILDTHLPSLLSHPSAPALLRSLSSALKPAIRTQRELADTTSLVGGASRVLRAAERTRQREKKSGAGLGSGTASKRRAKMQQAKEWQGVYRLEEFVL